MTRHVHHRPTITGYTPPPVVSSAPLTADDKSDMRTWRAMGFRIAAIARAYEQTFRDTRYVVRGVKRVKEMN